MVLNRRSLLSLLAAPAFAARSLRADLAILGGGVGGCAAALAALRNGLTVVMTEETHWFGGQITSQLVPAFDEHRWIEHHGSTRSYRDYRNAIRDYYRRYYPLTEAARTRNPFNPGAGVVSGFAVEPTVALHVLEAMLAPYLSTGHLTLLTRHKPASAGVDRDHVRAVVVRSVDSGTKRTIEAPYFLDATELGDLLPLTKTEYIVGAEGRSQTQEPSAPSRPEPLNQQSFTMCFAVDYLPGEDHTIDKPTEYPFWRDYVPQLRPAWSGKLLSWKMSHPRTLAPRDLGFDPTLKQREPGLLNLWLYRRVADRTNFNSGTYPSDITVVNWPQNDYWLGRLIDVPQQEFTRQVNRAKQLSLSLLYWMQTEAPRPDGGIGWKGLRLRAHVAGTEDGLAMYPYIREARRIQAEFTICEQHVRASLRPNGEAEPFADSCGTGSYGLDLHPTTGGNNYFDVASVPFQIPLGALIPTRMENLVPAAKNLGVTHITNGCYRLHPVEWNIGESAALLCAQAIRTGKTPRQIRNQPRSLADFQKLLGAQGVQIDWPRPLPK
ncbi:MAG: FAD-dependent oxidoreductase [Acidobacteria bacterium]|nr:FAD-dependent oxidoreductase [Acidobacteriota bacterium]